MPTNALPPPVLRGVFEDCTLNNACYSPVEDDIAAVGPSTSMFDNQLSFIDDEFFQEDYKDSKYEFVVENFPRCYEKYIESAPFDDGADGDLKWRLRIYPCLLGDDSNEYVGIFLRLDKCHGKRVMVSFSLSWLDDVGETVEFIQTPRPYLFYKNKDLGYANFLKRDVVLASMLQYIEQDEGQYCTEYNGNLRIACEVKIKSNAEAVDLETIGRYAYEECNDKSRSYKRPLLYII